MIYEIEQQPVIRIELTDYENLTLLNAGDLFDELIVKMGSIESNEIVLNNENMISITDLIFVHDTIRKFLPWQEFTIEGKLRNETDGPILAIIKE